MKRLVIKVGSAVLREDTTLAINRLKLNSFNDYINLLYNDSASLFSINDSFRPQHYWIIDDNNNLIVDKIYNLENDNFFIDFKMDRAKNDIKKNVSNKPNKIIIDENIKEKLKEVYKIDFEIYNNSLL